MLQVILKSSGKEWKQPVRLCDLQKALNLNLEGAAHVAETLLHEEPYTIEELSKFFEMTESEFVQWALSEKTKDLKSFKLRPRALHVYREAHRVYRFKDACLAGRVEEMGKLMQESHSSCRDLYECSHEMLDKLVSLCLSQGALGSRLTGAG